MKTTLPLLLLIACQQEKAQVSGGVSVGLLEIEGAVLRAHADGTIDIRHDDGVMILSRGFAAAQLDNTVDGPELRSDQGDVSVLQEDAQIVVSTIDADHVLTWTIGATDHFTFTLDVKNGGDAAVLVARTAPLRTEGPDGGLFLGGHPSSARILENGSFTMLDFVAEVLPGDVPLNEGYGILAPGNFAGHSVSNWNHAITDLEDGSSWIGGAVTFAASVPVANLSYSASRAGEEDGRTGFSYLSYESAYLPHPVSVAPGASWTSETFYVDPLPADPVVGLEHYADAIAASVGAVPWHRREPGRRVPNGWNSWSGSGSTGGYGTNIDETVILDNLDVMATEFRDWGMEWFQIDDGYEPTYGDWTWRADRFPNGPRWLSDQIRARGLKPGLWMAPFTLHDGAPLLDEHPEWMAETTAIGQVVVGDQHIVDLSNPEVHAWLEDLARTVRQDWGFDWLKLDFGYLAIFGDGFAQPEMTREQAWRASLQSVRDGLGPDAFFMLVGLLGLHYDIVDCGRTTLDNMPLWDFEPGSDPADHLDQQGFKPTMRTAGRRWYLQDRVWINHPDLLFYRTETEPDWPPLTPEESRAFTSFVGLSGGIVKIGERLVDMDAVAIDSVRRVLPILGTAARPLDVFEREFAEVWELDVEAVDGHDGSWQVYGLYNWGANLDYTVNPFVEIPDGGDVALEVEVGADVIAYEFWSGELLPVDGDKLEVTVPTHDVRVVAVRPKTGVPQFAGWNRQITMGGVLLEEATWSEADRTFTLVAPVVPGTAKSPFTWEIGLYLPAGYDHTEVTPSGVSVTGLVAERVGDLLRIRFEPDAVGELQLTVAF